MGHETVAGFEKTCPSIQRLVTIYTLDYEAVGLSPIESGWTKVHGHFLQMGGFVIDEPGKKPYTLSPEHLEYLLERRKIMFPTIRVEDIEDKSKADIIAKGFVAVQTLWFVTQCIVRRAKELTITELELVTLAFAAFNGITYFLWWHKPLDVRCPVHLQLVGQNSFISREVDEGNPANSTIWHIFRDIFNYMSDILFNIVEDIQRDGVIWALRKRLMLLVSPFIYVREILHQMTESDASANISHDATRVPIFYALKLGVTKEYSMDCIVSFCAMIFGAIHCVAWNFHFPSLTERTMWRVSSLIIFCVPAVLFFFSLLRLLCIHPFSIFNRPALVNFTDIDTMDRAKVVRALNIIGLIVYVPSRIIIVFLALLSLRSPGAKAFVDVDWTSFFPHFN